MWRIVSLLALLSLGCVCPRGFLRAEQSSPVEADGWKVTAVTSADGNLCLTVAVPDAGIIAGYRFPCRLELENVGDVTQTVNLSGFWALPIIDPWTGCLYPNQYRPSNPEDDSHNLAPGERVTVVFEQEAWVAWVAKAVAFMAWYENLDAGGEPRAWTGTVGPRTSASVPIIGGEKALHYGVELLENGIERDYATGIAIPVEEKFAEWERGTNRGKGARLLGGLKDTAAVGPLLKAMRDDKDQGLQVEATKALYEIAGMASPDSELSGIKTVDWISQYVPPIEAWAESYLGEHPKTK